MNVSSTQLLSFDTTEKKIRTETMFWTLFPYGFFCGDTENFPHIFFRVCIYTFGKSIFRVDFLFSVRKKIRLGKKLFSISSSLQWFLNLKFTTKIFYESRWTSILRPLCSSYHTKFTIVMEKFPVEKFFRSVNVTKLAVYTDSGRISSFWQFSYQYWGASSILHCYTKFLLHWIHRKASYDLIGQRYVIQFFW